MQKGSALLFVILVGLVLAVIVGGYVYLNKLRSNPQSQITSQVSNTDKTYHNTALNFEFRYVGKDLSVKEDSEEGFNKRGNGDFRKNFKGYVQYEPGTFLGAVVVLGKDNSYDTNPFTLWVFADPDDITIDKWFDKYWYYPFLWGVFDFESKGHVTLDKEATVSGVMAKYKIVSYQPGSPKYVYISKGKKMYLFRIIGAAGEKVLSTFKFL